MSKRVPHPPGPYTVEYLGDDTLTGIAFGYPIPGAGSPVPIGHVHYDEDPHRPGDISIRQAEAIARLFAASPDLFAACEEAAERLEGSDHPADQAFRERLLAVIAKARSGA